MRCEKIITLVMVLFLILSTLSILSQVVEGVENGNVRSLVTEDNKTDYNIYQNRDITQLKNMKGKTKDDYSLLNNSKSNKTDTTPPVADAGEDRTVKAGESFTLNASGSYDNKKIDQYIWSFHPGINKTGKICNHTFQDANPCYNEVGDECKVFIYTVTLKVVDKAGNTDTDNVKITVDETREDEEKGLSEERTPGFTFLILMFSLSLVAIYGYKNY